MSKTTWRNIADAHSNAEHACDLAGSMVALHPNATCVLQTFFLKISSRPTIERLYQDIFSIHRTVSRIRKTNEWYSENGLCAEWEYEFRGQTNERISAKRVSIFEFTGQRIISTRMFTDGLYTTLLKGALGSKYPTLPGVEDIGRSSRSC